MPSLLMSFCCVTILCYSSLLTAGEVTIVAPRDNQAPTELEQPFGIDFDSRAQLYFVELSGNRIKSIAASGQITTIGGTGETGDAGDGSSAITATFNGPHAIAVSHDDELYVADTWNNRIRKIDLTNGLITAFAGTGEKGFAGDGGPALDAKFSGIYAIAFNPDRSILYAADLDNRRIRAIEIETGIVTTIAGDGTKGIPVDGQQAKDAPLFDPRAVAADRLGRVYVLERSGHALRVIDVDGTIRTVAGTGKAGAGSDGPALQMAMNGPKHLCVDNDNNVIIADAENHRILKYLPATSQLVRIAGTGNKGHTLRPSPLGMELNRPHGVTVDAAGGLFIADSWNNRILRIAR